MNAPESSLLFLRDFTNELWNQFALITVNPERNPVDTARHTICFPRPLFVLAERWAQAEQRSLGSVLALALEHGLRDLMDRRFIPPQAEQAYLDFCESSPPRYPDA